MKRRGWSIALALVLVLNMVFAGTSVFAREVGPSVVFYVAPDGNDANDGSIGSPFATIKGARDAVRAYKAENGLPEGGITVYFRGGTYNITEKTDFEEQDSGTAESPITYKAYPNETPVFTGGYYVEGSQFQPVTDQAILDRLPSDDARSNIVQYDLKGNGITNYGEMYDTCGWGADSNPDGFGMKIAPMEVYIDDDPLILSRWPNRKADGTNDYIYTGESIAYGRKGTSPADELPQFKYTDERIEGWATYDDVCTLGFYKADYADDNVKLLNVDKENNIITLKTQLSHGVLEEKKYYYYNVLDELDDPGEYYIDRTNGILYLYPTKDMSTATVKLSSYDQPLVIECNNVSHVTFSGLTFELTRGSVFRVVGGDSVTIAYCTIKNCGIYGAYLGASSVSMDSSKDVAGNVAAAQEYDNAANGVNHKVTGCEIFNMGYGGVKMQGGNLYTLERADFSVENSKIYHYALRRRSYVNGVNYNGFGFKIAHNEIFDAPHAAVQGSAQGIVIEYNEFYDVVKETEDAGAIYTNYTWPVHDLHIRYNYIHDIPYSDFGHRIAPDIVLRAAVYVDSDLFCPDVYGNVMVNCPIGFMGAVKGEFIENNIFVDCRRAINRGGDCDYLKGYTGEEALDVSNGSFNLIQKYPFDQEPWKSAYPEFAQYMEDFRNSDNAAYWNGQWINNLIVYDKIPGFYERNLPEAVITTEGDEYVYKDNVITKEDPGFVDMANGNYQLKDDASFYQQVPDFEKLDMSKMGLLTDQVGAKLQNAIVLELGTPNALVNGELKAVDSDNLAVVPAVINDRTLVPVRFISESLGGVVGWDEATETVTIDIDGRQIVLKIGDSNIVVDGTATAMDVAAETIHDRTMIPLRALVEVGLNKNVFWDDRGLIVISDDANLLTPETDEAIIQEMLNYLMYR